MDIPTGADGEGERSFAGDIHVTYLVNQKPIFFAFQKMVHTGVLCCM